METQPCFSLCRPLSLLLSLVMLFTALASALPVSAAGQKPVDLDREYGQLVQLAVKGECDYELAYDVLELVNAERKKVKKPALTMDKNMMESAMLRAAECSIYYSHTRPSSENWSTTMPSIHNGAGENIAAGQTNAAEVMADWMNSPGHRGNILDESGYGYQSIGIGVFQIDGIYYWCQQFNGREKQANPTQKKPVSKTMTVEARLGLTKLSLNRRSVNLKDGETATLKVTNTNQGFTEFVHPIDPAGLTFTASKAGIVTISASGVVKPIGNGTTTITVKSKNGVKLFTVSVTSQVENPHKHSYTVATCTAPKTCKECGSTSGKALGHTYSNACDKSCNRCKATRTVAGHTYKKATTKATLTKNGSVKTICSSCGYTASKVTTLYKASKISLSKTTYTYNGKTQKPSVVVKDSQGKTISPSNYTVTYASGRKNVGTYKVTVKFKGNYSGTKTLAFKINPATTTVKATAAKKSLKLTVGKKTTQVTGYEVQYATSKSFKSFKSKLLTGYSKTSLTLPGLKAKTTYYVRVRTYKTVNGVKYYSGWSTIVSKKTK